MKGFLAAGIVGAALAYFFDPKSGGQRRSQITGKLSPGGNSPTSGLQTAASRAAGAVKGVMPHQPDNPNPDDRTLTDRVESELFANTEYGREHLNVNVVNGIVTVRGELPNQGEIDDVVARIRAIPNVRGVESYLHLPGTPAPNKVDSLRVSS